MEINEEIITEEVKPSSPWKKRILGGIITLLVTGLGALGTWMVNKISDMHDNDIRFQSSITKFEDRLKDIEKDANYYQKINTLISQLSEQIKANNKVDEAQWDQLINLIKEKNNLKVEVEVLKRMNEITIKGVAPKSVKTTLSKPKLKELPDNERDRYKQQAIRQMQLK